MQAFAGVQLLVLFCHISPLAVGEQRAAELHRFWVETDPLFRRLLSGRTSRVRAGGARRTVLLYRRLFLETVVFLQEHQAPVLAAHEPQILAMADFIEKNNFDGGGAPEEGLGELLRRVRDYAWFMPARMAPADALRKVELEISRLDERLMAADV